MENIVLLIVGMHRSGTSLVTQWLHRCGLHVGDRLLEASIGNDDGHFEDQDFLALHRSWLAGHPPFDETGLSQQAPAPLHPQEEQKAAELIAQKNSVHPQWGWKEPRTTLWLPLYRRLLPAAFSLVVIRRFNDTVNSLVMRDYKFYLRAHEQKLTTKKGLSYLKWKYLKKTRVERFYQERAEGYLKVWILYYQIILEHVHKTANEKSMLVNYEDLVRNDRQVYDVLTKQWNFQLQYIPFATIFKQNLLSDVRDIRNYIRDKELIQQATRLQEACAERLPFLQTAG